MLIKIISDRFNNKYTYIVITVIFEPAYEFTEPIFLVNMTTIGTVLSFFLKDEIFSTAVIED